MLFVEVFAPKGSLNEEQRQHISRRLVPELISADGAPVDLIERGRSMSWLVFHEPEVWTVGGHPHDAFGPSRYVVRLTMPAGHANDSIRAEMVTRTTRVLAEIEEDPEHVYRDPHAWIHINEIPDGNAGILGRSVRTSDLMRMIVNGSIPDTNAPAQGPASETVIDPICGMTVVLDAEAITLVHEGTTYGFCNPGCRDVFMEQHGIAVH